MGVRKQGSPRRQPVEVRGLDLRMPAQATNPIIQIINGQKQNVLFFVSAPVFITRADKRETKARVRIMSFMVKGFFGEVERRLKISFILW